MAMQASSPMLSPILVDPATRGEERRKNITRNFDICIRKDVDHQPFEVRSNDPISDHPRGGTTVDWGSVTAAATC
ncbi:hypothetical protein E2562_028425 [Oryza meyeriana var. granulata]|uniref:Uncharacterized protein n=1 Tax=Oryza meyeriana var. granulata TaxID=110450 RepID=A0A6G1EQN9_9ORYZ|nr:hypothetical protein E2562_028425 [Oryza meyeriana var. granulata]